jgi:hypothetical protein
MLTHRSFVLAPMASVVLVQAVSLLVQPRAQLSLERIAPAKLECSRVVPARIAGVRIELVRVAWAAIARALTASTPERQPRLAAEV